MALRPVCTHSARGRKYKVNEDGFTQRAGGGTVGQRMHCHGQEVAKGWLRHRMGSEESGSVDQLPPT